MRMQVEDLSSMAVDTLQKTVA